MLVVVAALLLTQGPTSPGPAPAHAIVAAPPRVLVLDTRADEALLPHVKAFGDLFATLLERATTAEVVPASSIRDRLAVAADKAQAGCDDTACMTELAGALDARYVVASRASAVGGRWLMRVELFDSQDLKVVAQTSTMSDSIEGIAAQAELLAEDLLNRAPMLPRRGASTAPSASSELPPPDQKSGGFSNWAVAGGAGAGAVLAATTGILGFLWAAGEEGKMNDALRKYEDDPTADTREALAIAGQDASRASTVQNCLLAPIGCLSVPLLGVAIGGAVYGLQASDDDAAGGAP